MAEYDAAWCLSTFRQMANLPDEAPDPSATTIYDLVTQGCRRVTRMLAQHVAHAVMQPAEQLTTANDGITYTFAYYPFGGIELRSGRTGRLLLPTVDWDLNNSDGYVLDGNLIRWPGGKARTFSDGLWARYVAEHGTVDASTAPTLTSPALRAAIYDAVAEWADQGGAIDPAPFLRGRNRELWGDPQVPGDQGLIGMWKVQALGQGQVSPGVRTNQWWYSGDFSR